MQPEINWDKVEIIQNKQSLFWFIAKEHGAHYLHYNGQWCDTVSNDDGALCGYYNSKESAMKVVEKYRPRLKLSQLKYGDKFRFKDGSFNNSVLMKIRTGAFSYAALCMTRYEIIDIAFDHEVILEKS